MKRILSLILAAAAVVCITGCKKEPAKKELSLDVRAAGQAILNGTAFESKPEELPDATPFVSSVLKLDEATLSMNGDKPEVYAAVSSASPEIVVVIGAKDAAAAQAISSGAINEYIRYNIDGYKNYGPEKVPMLESCANKVEGRYVFYVVSADNAKAASIIKDLIANAGK